MNSLFSRKLHLVYLLSDRMEHPERPKKLYLQLPVMLCLDVFAVQPNFFARSVAPRLNSFIMSLFLKFLGIMEVLIIHNLQVSKFC